MASPTEFKLRTVRTHVGDLALVTMDNGEDWQKPNTFGEAALRSLQGLLDRIEEREWAGLVLTGKPYVFAVGADIDEFGEITPERAREGSEAGHELFGRIRELPFVTVAAINGAAVGGGVEIALHCDYRTIASSVRHFACPEVFLGLIPGWGGTQLVPQLVGAEQAVKFVVENPLRQNRMHARSSARSARSPPSGRAWEVRPATSSSVGSATSRSSRWPRSTEPRSAAVSRSRCTATTAPSRRRSGTSPARRCFSV